MEKINGHAIQAKMHTEIMRLSIIFILLVLFDIYVFQAFLELSQGWSKIVKTILYAVYWFVPLVVMGTMVASVYTDVSKWDRNLYAILRAVLLIIYLSKFLIVVVLFVDDIRRLLMSAYDSIAGTETFDKGRSAFLSQMAILVGTLPLVTLTYGIIRNRYRYKVYREIVPVENLPKSLDGLKIVQISDIHSGSFTMKEPVKQAIDLINKQEADLVFFTGDLVNSVASEMDDYVDVFDKIKSKHGVYSILGNHDYGDYARWDSLDDKKKNFRRLIDTHRQMGWNILLNENRNLEINGEKISIIGVENYSASPRFQKYGDLDKAYEGSGDASLKLLLSHDPTHWEAQVIEKFKDIAITFSGHTHGFQFGIEIPGWIKWSPSKYIYKHWAGLYKTGKQYLYVNRGLGFLGYPGRVGILPEITVIKLKRYESRPKES